MLLLERRVSLKKRIVLKGRFIGIVIASMCPYDLLQHELAANNKEAYDLILFSLGFLDSSG
jgi:hypothetical protein